MRFGKEPIVAGLIFFLVVAVFGQTLRHGFVNYDDDKYVCENQRVSPGITLDGLAWAFTGAAAANWHPITWLSHQADCQFYGLAPRGHHLTNVLLHAAVAVLLMMVLFRMTGDFWPSAFTAAVFAMHPLRVESVAWIAERKDLLAGLFFMLTLAAYANYARRPFSHARYALVVLAFALGLMSKPMLVSVPAVLLLLDYWPLERFAARRPWPLFAEKIPLLAMSAASCVVTLCVQNEAIALSRPVPLPWRLGNALVACVSYVGAFFHPANLAVLYPHPGDELPAWKIAASAVILTLICTIAVLQRRRRPWLPVGWFWNLIMLLPVIGLVQVGYQAMADRYTYLPQIGLCMALTWTAWRAAGSLAWGRWLCGASAVAILAALTACTCQQITYWENSETLWRRAIACTTGNYIAHYNLGVTLARDKLPDDAIAEYQNALKIDPKYTEARYNLAVLLARRGETQRAIAEYREVVKSASDFADAENNLGSLLASLGQRDEAILHYRRALRIAPGLVDAENNLGNAILAQGHAAEAISHYEKVLKMQPDHAEAENNMAVALERLARPDDAIAHYEKALSINPKYAQARNNLVRLLLNLGKLDAARSHLEKAHKIESKEQ